MEEPDLKTDDRDGSWRREARKMKTSQKKNNKSLLLYIF